MQSAALGFLLAQTHFADPLVAVPSAVSVVFMAWAALALRCTGATSPPPIEPGAHSSDWKLFSGYPGAPKSSQPPAVTAASRNKMLRYMVAASDDYSSDLHCPFVMFISACLFAEVWVQKSCRGTEKALGNTSFVRKTSHALQDIAHRAACSSFRASIKGKAGVYIQIRAALDMVEHRLQHAVRDASISAAGTLLKAWACPSET